jgi:GTP-binding protein
LGIRFLKHVERTKVIAHLLDLTQLDENGEEMDLERAFDAINHELKEFSEELATRPQLVVLTKLDASSSQERVQHFAEKFKSRGYQVAVISSVVGTGISSLIEELADFAYDRRRE